MRNWAITYDAIDRSKSKVAPIRRTASFSKEKWYRDAIEREVIFFGVSRTLPAVERKDLSRFTNKNVVFEPNNIKILGTDASKYISRILGRDVSEYSVVQSDEYGSSRVESV